MRESRGSTCIERKVDAIRDEMMVIRHFQGRQGVALHRLLIRTRKIMAKFDPINAEIDELKVSAAAATAKLAQLRGDVKAAVAEIARLTALLEEAGTDEAAIAEITEKLNAVEDDLEAAAVDPVDPPPVEPPAE